MTRVTSETLTPERVRSAAFSLTRLGRRGVDEGEVRAFCDWVAGGLERLLSDNAGLQEEVIVVGYLYERLGRLGWGRWTIILSTAVLRGSYHLYQGFGAFVGNAVMGIAFGWIYTRWGRLWPLVVAHCLLDAIVFSWSAAIVLSFPPPAFALYGGG